MTSEAAYVLGEGPDEGRRLRDQSTVLDPITRRLLVRAGLEPGMTVLDLGSGAGNVAAIAADLVGPTGQVVGVDRDPEALENARNLTAGLDNVEFRQGDVGSLDVVSGEFDAVVGRAVLMHLPDPVAALRVAAERVRPGGVLCMHEPDMTCAWTSHEVPLWETVRGWILEAFDRGGVHSRMGPSLFAAFRSAGLADPEVVMEAPVGGGARSPAFGWANIVEALLPVMERLGITTAQEADVETLTARLDEAISAYDGLVMGPPMYGAWCTPGR
ncbi:class I SAM-dependent methyltransferase [Aeromicrobium sp. CTD01-1L150]|uniref:class I SAM-dependent methyltransferase n=1 Tax=Aeromicrobium sp. CTD01-1L150 TaxID=3341830 RepID=UPI0035BEC592